MSRRRSAIVLVLVVVALGGIVWRLFAPDPAGERRTGSNHARGGSNDAAAAAARADSLVADATDATRGTESDARREAERSNASDADAPRNRDLYVGRIVDERRLPIADANATLRYSRGGRVEFASARSNSDGRFEIGVARPPPASWTVASVYAADAAGRFAFLKFWFGGATLDVADDGLARTDVGTLVLRSGATLRITVEGSAGAAAGAWLHLEIGKERTCALDTQADADGTAVVRGVPLEEVVVVAATEHERGRATVVVASGETTAVLVRLRPTYSIDVHVREAESEAPIAGATLTFNESVIWLQDHFSSFPQLAFSSRGIDHSEVKTDASGNARVDDLEADVRLTISASAEGYGGDAPLDELHARAGLPDAAPDVTLHLTPSRTRTVRWPVVAGSAPVPPSGSEIRLRPTHLRMESEPAKETLVGRMEGSDLVVERAPSGWLWLVAEAPDGSVAVASASKDATSGEAIEFKRGLRVDVVVRDPTGAPAAGVRVQLRDQGNNSVAQDLRTSADGAAHFERLVAGFLDVYVSSRPSRWPNELAGTVQLSDQDARIEYKLRGEFEALVEVVIDGAHRLPSDYALTASGGGAIQDSTEDPDHGRIRIRLQRPASDAPIDVWMRALGFLPGHAAIPRTAGDEMPLVTLTLERAGSLLARVVKSDQLRAGLLCQRWNDAKGKWEKPADQYSAMTWPNGPGDSYLFDPIPPGRYRVLDERSGVESEAVDVVAGARAEASLDLSHVVEVSGRVEVPPGEDATLARVIIDDGNHATEPQFWGNPENSNLPGVGVDKSGAFRLLASTGPGGQLRAWHPSLRPAADGGRAAITGATSSLTLRLEAGPLVTFTPRFEGENPKRPMDAALVVDAAGRRVTHHLLATSSGDAMRFLAPDATRARLVLDPGLGWAPFAFTEIALTGKDQDLGEVLFRRGSALRVKLEPRPGSQAPRFYLSATSLDDPRYSRWMNSNGEAEALLQGLGPGRFDVRVGTIMNMTTLYSATLEIDGVNETVIPIELK